MKKTIIALMIAAYLFLSACRAKEKMRSVETIMIPDVADTSQTIVENVLTANRLIPVIKYEYNDDTKKDNVIRTQPSIGSAVEPNSKVTVYISLGPWHIDSVDSQIEWFDLGNGQDDWEFRGPYIEGDILYIECLNVTFATAMEWNDPYDSGSFIGMASTDKSLEKSVPISARYQKKNWSKNEAQDFTLAIPLNDLTEELPNCVYLQLHCCVDGISEDVIVNFIMTW